MPPQVELQPRSKHHVIFSGRSLIVTNRAGEITGHGIEGFYADETRALSRHELSIDVDPIDVFSASPVDGDGYLAYAEVSQLPTVPGKAVYLTISRRLGPGLREEIVVDNRHGSQPAQFNLTLSLAA